MTVVYKQFQELNKSGDYENMYLLLSMQYDRMNNTLPDPIWWLMCSDEAVTGFMRCFMECFDAHMKKRGLLAPAVEEEISWF